MSDLAKVTQIAKRNAEDGTKALVVVSHEGRIISYEGYVCDVTFDRESRFQTFGMHGFMDSVPVSYEQTLTVHFSGDVIKRVIEQ